MAGNSKIEWTEATWNPVTGCTKISAGCQNCYAERMAKRLKAMGQHKYRNGFEVTCHPDALEDLLRWRKPRRVFVCSMGDLFHEAVPSAVIRNVFGIMHSCQPRFGKPAHLFQVLTKRPERMREFLEKFASWVDAYPEEYGHVWLGVTAENQQAADDRIPLLLQTSAAVRFVSLEPMLEPVDLQYDWLVPACPGCGRHEPYCDCDLQGEWSIPPSIDWVIVGGESGPGCRPFEWTWARSIRDQCAMAGVPFFLKQGGGYPNKRAKWEDIPEDLRIREFPR